MALYKVLHIGGNKSGELNRELSSDDTGNKYDHFDVGWDMAVEVYKGLTRGNLTAVCLYPEELDKGKTMMIYPSCSIKRAMSKIDPYMARRSALCVDGIPTATENRFKSAQVMPPPIDIQMGTQFNEYLRQFLQILGKPLGPSRWRRWLHWIGENYVLNPIIRAQIDFDRAGKIFDAIVGDEIERFRTQVVRMERLRTGYDRGAIISRPRSQDKPGEICVHLMNQIRECIRQVQKIREVDKRWET